MRARSIQWILPLVMLGAQASGAAAQIVRAQLGVPTVASGDSALPKTLSLTDLVNMALVQNPSLAQAGLDIEGARGQVRQSGLYPNPTVMFRGDEMGRDGGIITAPMVTQEIITAGKRKLDIAIASKKYDQATIGLMRQKFILIAAVRQGYFEVLTTQQRVATLTGLEQIAKNSYDNTRRLLEAKQVAQLDLLQVQVELNRVQAELAASKREQTAAWRRLVATIGVPNLGETPVSGSIEGELPTYDFEAGKGFLVDNHPEVGVARVGVDQAQLALRRSEVQKIPNVMVGMGFMRNNNDRADQWAIQVGLPLPIFNRNQGNIMTARADLEKSVYEVSRVQNDLSNRFATAFGSYAAAKERVDQYRKLILPTAQQANKIALDAYKGGQFEYLRVLQSQRALLEANLEYIRALGEAWRAASEISGLLLEENMRVPLAAPKK